MNISEFNARKAFKDIQNYCKQCKACSPKKCIFAYEHKEEGPFKGDYDCIFKTAPLNIILRGIDNDVSKIQH